MRVVLLFSMFVSLLSWGQDTVTAGTQTDGGSDVEAFMHEAAGVNFYVEKRGAGPAVVLIPSGQGDCGAYKYIAERLADEFTVYTFDQPGFSRSGDPPDWSEMSTKMLGDQAAALVRSLGIEKASFYGSSSGGMTVMAIVADHTDLVRDAIVHEPAAMDDVLIPNWLFPRIIKWRARGHDSFEEAERATILTSDALISDPSALVGLGEGHLERRIKNYQIWYDRYLVPDVPCCSRSFTAEELNRAPLKITVGSDTTFFFTYGMSRLADRGELELVELPSKHMPYVTIPDTVAEMIKESAREYFY